MDERYFQSYDSPIYFKPTSLKAVSIVKKETPNIFNAGSKKHFYISLFLILRPTRKQENTIINLEVQEPYPRNNYSPNYISIPFLFSSYISIPFLPHYASINLRMPIKANVYSILEEKIVTPLGFNEFY